jgi:ribosomal protein L7Ae-like RNA K-turn-binding protein
LFIWLAITTDKLELPIAVADTAKELGEMLGKSENAIYKTVDYYKSGERKRKCPYIRVSI